MYSFNYNFIYKQKGGIDTSNTPVVSLSNNHYPYCLVLVGSRNGFERGFTIELKQSEGLMED